VDETVQETQKELEAEAESLDKTIKDIDEEERPVKSVPEDKSS